MIEMIATRLMPCERPPETELVDLETPYRPFSDGNGWYAHYLYFSDGRPAFKRLTHGDHAELWYRAVQQE
jgi:hypothetical protein